MDRLRRIEKLKQTNVVISLFGASLSGTISPGKAVVHDVVPVCIETLKAGIVPASKFNIDAYQTVWASKLIETVQSVRSDMFKDSSNLDRMDEDGFAKMLQEDADAAKARALRKETKKRAKKSTASRKRSFNPKNSPVMPPRRRRDR